MTNTNFSVVDIFEIDDERENDEFLEVSFTVEERERGLPPFAHATIEWIEDGVSVETFSISSAEKLYNALGLAIEAAKNEVNKYLEGRL